MKKTKYAVFLALAFVASTSAQTTFIGITNGSSQWTNPASWSGGTVPDAIGQTVVFTNIVVSNGVLWQNTNITVGTINFQNASGNVVVGDNTVTTDTLTLDTSSGKPVLNVSNANGTAFIYASLLGTNGFTKTGAGNLTFRFNTTAMTYTGDINLNAGTLTINQDSSLGDANNDIVVGGTSTLAISPGSNTGSVALGSGRSITINSGTLTISTLNNNAVSNVPTTIDGVIGGAGALTFIGSSPGTNSATANSYTLNGANSYAGATIIQMGAKVALGSGSAVGTNSLSFSSGSGSFAQLDLGGNTQNVSALTNASSTGTARTFVITNGTLNVGSGANFLLNGINGTTVNMSGLTAFTFNGAAGNRNFTVTPDTVSATATNTNSVFLANSGAASNNISAAAITVGGATGTSQGGDHQGQLHLGNVNFLSANSLTIGGFNGSGLVALQSGITDGSLTLRGSNAVGRMGTLIVGATSSGVRSGAGTLNISNGTIDASISNTYIGLYGANSTGPNTTSLLAMGGGNFDSLNMLVAGITNTSLTNASSTTTGTFQQNGGTAKIQTLTLGDSASAGNTNATKSTFTANYNLSSSNATLFAQTIRAGSTTTDYSTATRRKINFGAGTIRNYDASTDLTIQGIDTTLSGRLEIAVASNSSTKVFYADAGRKITIADTAVLTSTGGITKDGSGTLILNGANTYSGGTVVDAGTLTVNNTSGSGTGTGALTVNGGATLNGSGIIGSATDIGGIHSPGNSPGIQTFTNGLTYLTGATFVWELTANATTVRGTAFDGVDVTGGTLTINTGVTNNLVFNGAGSAVLWADTFWDSNQSWQVFADSSTPSLLSTNVFDTINVSLDSLGNDFATSRAGSSFTWTTVGNDVYLNYTVPEPGTYALLALAAAGFGAHVLRRRTRR